MIHSQADWEHPPRSEYSYTMAVHLHSRVACAKALRVETWLGWRESCRVGCSMALRLYATKRIMIGPYTERVQTWMKLRESKRRHEQNGAANHSSSGATPTMANQRPPAKSRTTEILRLAVVTGNRRSLSVWQVSRTCALPNLVLFQLSTQSKHYLI